MNTFVTLPGSKLAARSQSHNLFRAMFNFSQIFRNPDYGPYLQFWENSASVGFPGAAVSDLGRRGLGGGQVSPGHLRDLKGPT